MSVAIIDYGSGNLRSAAKAFERMARERGGSDEILVTDKPDQVRAADHIVLPGVGAFGDCRAGLEALPGMIDALNEIVTVKARPFLGICVGMQLMADEGLENGRHQGLGWISGAVGKINPADETLKIPHMGWNDLSISATSHPVLNSLSGQKAETYFVHSFAMQVSDPEQILATTDYGGEITAIIGRDNMIGTQFHPEKSQRAGLELIGNFLEWRP